VVQLNPHRTSPKSRRPQTNTTISYEFDHQRHRMEQKTNLKATLSVSPHSTQTNHYFIDIHPKSRVSLFRSRMRPSLSQTRSTVYHYIHLYSDRLLPHLQLVLNPFSPPILWDPDQYKSLPKSPSPSTTVTRRSQPKKIPDSTYCVYRADHLGNLSEDIIRLNRLEIQDLMKQHKPVILQEDLQHQFPYTDHAFSCPSSQKIDQSQNLPYVDPIPHMYLIRNVTETYEKNTKIYNRLMTYSQAHVQSLNRPQRFLDETTLCFRIVAQSLHILTQNVAQILKQLTSLPHDHLQLIKTLNPRLYHTICLYLPFRYILSRGSISMYKNPYHILDLETNRKAQQFTKCVTKNLEFYQRRTPSANSWHPVFTYSLLGQLISDHSQISTIQRRPK